MASIFVNSFLSLWIVYIFLNYSKASKAVTIPSQTLMRGQCVSNCLRLHGTRPTISNSSHKPNLLVSAEFYQSLRCRSQFCSACLQPCHLQFVSDSFCQENCKTLSPQRNLIEICSKSCSKLYKTNPRSIDLTKYSYNFSDFGVVCQNTGISYDENYSVSIYLGWRLKGEENSTTQYLPISYILMISTNGTVRFSAPTIGDLFHVSGLESGVNYKLQLSGVSDTGGVIRSGIVSYQSIRSSGTNVLPSSILVSKPKPRPGKTAFIDIEWTGKSCWNLVKVLPYNNKERETYSFFTGPGVRRIHRVKLSYAMSYQITLTSTNEFMNITGHVYLKKVNIPNCQEIVLNSSLLNTFCTAPPISDITTPSNRRSNLVWKKFLSKKEHVDILSLPKLDIQATKPSLYDQEQKETFSNQSPQISVVVWLLPLFIVSIIGSGLGFIFCKLRRANKSVKSVVHITKNPAYEPSVATLPRREVSNLTDPLEVSPSDFIIEKDIGEGEFGMVFSARIQTRSLLSRRLPGKSHVAVKLLKPDASGPEEAQFVKEIKIMKQIRPHPNVLRLLGYCTQHSNPAFPMCLLTELCPFGDLKCHLDGLHRNLDKLGRPCDDQLVRWSVQIAEGMSHLANSGVVHRDLAARNILIGEEFQLKISDFGLCRDVCRSVDSEYHLIIGGRLPYRWLAPECFSKQTYSTASDVWAFGVLLWEIWTLGATPYGPLSSASVVDLLKGGSRLQPPSTCPSDLVTIMNNCWLQEPATRPSFSSLLSSLRHSIVNQRQYLDVAGEADNGSSIASTISSER